MKNIRLISLATLALASVCSLQAQAHFTDTRFVSGVTFTHEDRSGTLTSTYTTLPATGTGPATNRALITDSGSGYGGFFGVRGVLNNWLLLGLEAHVESARIEGPTNFTSVTANAAPLSFATTAAYKRATQWGLTAIAGRQWIPSIMTYLRIGAQQSSDRLAVTNVFTSGPFAAAGNDYHEVKSTITNFLLGVGAEVPLFSDKTAIRFEYDYLFADNHHSTDSTGILRGTHTYGPDSKIFKLQWIWKLPAQL